jgi:ABC-type multidrug transport system ATPase subunit
MQEYAVVVNHLSIRTNGNGSERPLLDNISFRVPPRHFAAVIGSSGCGKTTLLRAIAGLVLPTRGHVSLLGYPCAEFKRRFPLALGYLPQFSVAHEDLSVMEILRYDCELQLPASVKPATRQRWLAYLVNLAGLKEVAGQRYRTLSGGQRRRVALAEALMSDPPILLVDELTSGLDPQAESDMMEWLRYLAHQAGKTIVLVTHAVRNLDKTDSVLFMKRGRLLFHGNENDLRYRYGLTNVEELYYQDYAMIEAGAGRHAATAAAQPDGNPHATTTAAAAPTDATAADQPADYPPAALSQPHPVRTAGPASTWHQFSVLVRRQFLLFARDRGQILLHLVILFTFPALVAVFALGGLPQVRNLSLAMDPNIIRSLQERLLYLKESLSSATLVSGLIMFQVILLTLAGANNGSREIAKERGILDKEQRTGLSTPAYVASKMVWVTTLAMVQAFWMTWFVKSICRFPGDFGVQYGVLFMTTLAMGTTCLAISAHTTSTEKASLLAIYLVGLQLPLSGSVLALPDWLMHITRPFIAAYWGWSGYLKSLQDYRIYDIVRETARTWLAPPSVVCLVLALHVAAALAGCLFFVRRSPARPI